MMLGYGTLRFYSPCEVENERSKTTLQRLLYFISPASLTEIQTLFEILKRHELCNATLEASIKHHIAGRVIAGSAVHRCCFGPEELF